MSSFSTKRFLVLLFLVLCFGVPKAQTRIAYYPLDVDSRDTLSNFGNLIYGQHSTPPPSSACALGVYEGHIYTPDLGGFSTPGLFRLFNKQNFAIETDFSVSSSDFGFFGRPVLMMDPGYRTIGIYISVNSYIGIKYNNSNYLYSTTKTIVPSTVYHVSLRYVDPTAQLLVDGNVELTIDIPMLNFAPESALYAGYLTTGDGSNGGIFNGCMNNLIIYSQGVVLPVTLLSFEAKLQEANASCLLSWQAAGNRNVKNFTVQRSADGTKWQDIGVVPTGQKTSSNVQYRFTDGAALTGAGYYRLQQTDNNGSVSFSATRLVNNTPSQAGITILPNPVKNRLYITLVDWSTVQSVSLLNGMGNSVYQNKTAKDGIDVRSFAPGTYFLVIQTTKGSSYRKPVLIQE